MDRAVEILTKLFDHKDHHCEKKQEKVAIKNSLSEMIGKVIEKL